MKNYLESDAWDNLSAEPYNATALAEDVIGYTKEIGSDAQGNLRALCWQATPGGLWYKRSMAKEYLGTDDPEEVSKMLSSTEGMLDVAKTIHDKSDGKTAFVTNFQDLWMMSCYVPVSYTHLDVYKRQVLYCGALPFISPYISDLNSKSYDFEILICV